MSRGPTDLVLKKRRREGKTDYNLRLKLIASGKPRLVVRKSLKNVYAQLIQYQEAGDKILATSNSRDLIKLGWKHSRKNIPAAYLTGLLIGKKAKEAGIKSAVFDSGLYKSIKGNVVYAVLKGAVEGGLEVPHSAEVLPKERASGAHTKNADAVKKDIESIKKKIGAKE